MILHIAIRPKNRHTRHMLFSRSFICRAARSALLIENLLRKKPSRGLPHQLLASRYGAARNFFFRNSDENGRRFNADSGAEFGD
jgi:hypothetical protein